MRTGERNLQVNGHLRGAACRGSYRTERVGKTACQTDRMDIESVDLKQKLSLFTDLWSPKVVARMNDYEVKVVKVKGEFVWHRHENTDEMFLVLQGHLRINMHEGSVDLGPGQMYVVPKGVEHCPSADEEAHAWLLEPRGLVNTGDAGGALTAAYDDSLM